MLQKVIRIFIKSKDSIEFVKILFDSANEYYRMPGLITQVTIKMVGRPIFVPDADANWEAGSPKSWLRSESLRKHASNDPEVDNFAFFTHDLTHGRRFKDTAIGVAFRATACLKSEKSENNFPKPGKANVRKLLFFRFQTETVNRFPLRKRFG